MNTRCPELREGCRVICPVGEIDLATAPAFRDQLRGNDAALPAFVVADLRQVSFIDSSGLQELMKAQSRCEAAGGWVRIVYDHEAVDLLLRLTGYAEQFPRYTSVEDARDDRAPEAANG
ncbi:STAS domain-containing protein [Streptomyces monomycini]|uniref:STAS domain-containing protein n=1 Tax=Streptomyces monomycini TaxID=371720 RepID=UPI001EEA7E05|nr:STAS domain-containing protein [Streptomyces monomycini]